MRIERISLGAGSIAPHLVAALLRPAAAPPNPEEGFGHQVTIRLRNSSKVAFTGLSVSVTCPDDQQLALLVDDLEIGPNGEILKFVDALAGSGARIVDQTLKEVDKFRKTPIKSITDAPGVLVREGGNAVNWAKKRLTL